MLRQKTVIVILDNAQFIFSHWMRGPSYHCKEFATLSPGTRHSCTLPWRIRQVEANFTKRKSDYFPFYTLWHPSGLSISAHWSNQALPSYSAVTHKEPGLWKSFCISVQLNFPTLQVTIMERMVDLGCDPLAANRWLWLQKKNIHFLTFLRPPFNFCHFTTSNVLRDFVSLLPFSDY